MVAIHRPQTSSWIESIAPAFKPAELEPIARALSLAQSHYDEKTLQHATGTAGTLVGMNMDFETIIAALLHALPERMPDWQDKIAGDFGANVAALIEGMLKMEQIRQLSRLRPAEKGADVAQQIESLRKMLLAMVSDIRVVLIKLAERTQTMRTLSEQTPEQQRLIADETQSLFAPLANRLGVWQIKWELEDLSVRYLNPELYKKIARLLDERRLDRERYIGDIVERLRQALNDASISAEVTGRPKHIYSIINKMKRKHLDFEQLYDVRAVRILVDDVQNCYAALSLVHELWEPISSEFDDYIAHPKSNNYRSLHTAVTGPRGLAFEVQIRTHEMHRHSELGVAAHWRYKEDKKSDARFDEKIIWLRQILEWKDELAEQPELRDQFKNELFHDQVYVLTPQGRVIDLPRGATPVDFAYMLHTDLGHRTRGAKVDGAIVPLNYKLQNGQRVEILTTKQGGPSRDWINPSLGYLQGARARAKVRAWFKSQNIDESIAAGRAQLDRELQRLNAGSVNQEKLAQRLHFNKLDDLLAALGRNEITQLRIARALREELPNRIADRPAIQPKPAAPRQALPTILIEGVGNLATRTAKCCNPVPPDDIAGYVTSARGITIHRRDCPFVRHLIQERGDRMLVAKWRE